MSKEADRIREWRKVNPEKHKEQMKNWQANRKAKEQEQGAAQKHQCKCLECGIVFDRDKALLEGFRFIRAFRGICSSCDAP